MRNLLLSALVVAAPLAFAKAQSSKSPLAAGAPKMAIVRTNLKTGQVEVAFSNHVLKKGENADNLSFQTAAINAEKVVPFAQQKAGMDELDRSGSRSTWWRGGWGGGGYGLGLGFRGGYGAGYSLGYSYGYGYGYPGYGYGYGGYGYYNPYSYYGNSYYPYDNCYYGYTTPLYSYGYYGYGSYGSYGYPYGYDF